jgi:uncharacterized membrane protein YcaP (DUF421 family)
MNDPLRIVIRVVFAYSWILLMTRLSGKRTIKHSDAASFVLALVFGDMFDDLLWAEVSAAQFVVGVGTLVVAELLAHVVHARTGARIWRREHGVAS